MVGTQHALFGDETLMAEAKPSSDAPQNKRVLITVKAAPNPSQNHGETVCVAGIHYDHLGNRGWIRLYPINFRHLNSTDQFTKYDVVTVDCKPARHDGRLESWKPIMGTMRRETHLKGWPKRRPWVDSLVEDDMCDVRKAAGSDPRAQSLALIRPTDIGDFTIEEHPGWSSVEQAKIDAYVGQLDLFDTVDKTPLEAPEYRGVYSWRCANAGCGGHKQTVLDWEFVALQRNLRRDYGPTETRQRLRTRWLDDMCGPGRETAFFVGNQAKRPQTFSILGVYWPRVTD